MTTLWSVPEKDIREAMHVSNTRKGVMEYKADGPTLDSLAENAFIEYLLSLKTILHDESGFEIQLNMRDVFLAGYMAGEEGKWK